MSEEEKKDKKLIIEGVTESGQVFRPSDWAERMSGLMSTFHNHKIRYSPLLKPSFKNGHKCIVLDNKLKESNPKVYQSILAFAKKNKLKICDDEES